MWRKAFRWLLPPTASHPTVVSSSAFSSYDATANRVVKAALSANDNAIYCIVTPCECLMAIVILAMCSPHFTAAVAKPLLRLWIVALY